MVTHDVGSHDGEAQSSRSGWLQGPNESVRILYFSVRSLLGRFYPALVLWPPAAPGFHSASWGAWRKHRNLFPMISGKVRFLSHRLGNLDPGGGFDPTVVPPGREMGTAQAESIRGSSPLRR